MVLDVEYAENSDVFHCLTSASRMVSVLPDTQGGPEFFSWPEPITQIHISDLLLVLLCNEQFPVLSLLHSVPAFSLSCHHWPFFLGTTSLGKSMISWIMSIQATLISEILWNLIHSQGIWCISWKSVSENPRTDFLEEREDAGSQAARSVPEILT